MMRQKVLVVTSYGCIWATNILENMPCQPTAYQPVCDNLELHQQEDCIGPHIVVFWETTLLPRLQQDSIGTLQFPDNTTC